MANFSLVSGKVLWWCKYLHLQSFKSNVMLLLYSLIFILTDSKVQKQNHTAKFILSLDVHGL